MSKNIKELAQDWKLPFNALMLNEKGFLTVEHPPPPSKHHFFCKGIKVNLFLSSDESHSTCRMWAEICLLPYTAEYKDGRERAFKILRGSNGLPDVNFVVERDQRILAMYERKKEGTYTLDGLVSEVLSFMKQAEPFAVLLKKYVSM